VKLLRASCPCGYVTRKARSGYHHDQWWFPLFSIGEGALSDVRAALPKSVRKRIDELQFDIYHQTPRDDKMARRHATARMREIEDAIRRTFIERQQATLRNRYESDGTCVFDPPPNSRFRCPDCGDDSLILDQVRVVAVCKADCAHEYDWPDSEEHGCPQCDYRPHAFRAESEARSEEHARTICFCPCSSTTDCTSHTDGYCPKCGALPDVYTVKEESFCGEHHEEMIPYNVPSNFVFRLPNAPRGRVPNAKFWGDATDESDSVAGSYCVLCENEYRSWLESQNDDDG